MKVGEHLMTDMQLIANFISLMGFNYTIKEDGKHTIIFFDDNSWAPNVSTRGYDNIEFLYEFDGKGKMVNGYISSHVAYAPVGYPELMKRFSRI